MRSLPRRRLLALSGLAAVPMVAKNVRSEEDSNQNSHVPGYIKDIDGSYGNEAIDLSIQNDGLTIGTNIRLKIHNKSAQTIMFGCNFPWALQKKSGDNWVHVGWTPEEYYELCGNPIAGGEEDTTEIPTSANDIESVSREITPGTYRIVILGPPSPPVTVFELRE